jgi:hypothetical protein
MAKIILWIFIAVFVVGGIAASTLIPESWLARLPPYGQIALVSCAVIYAALTLISIVMDSDILQKIFKKK